MQTAQPLAKNGARNERANTNTRFLDHSCRKWLAGPAVLVWDVQHHGVYPTREAAEREKNNLATRVSVYLHN